MKRLAFALFLLCPTTLHARDLTSDLINNSRIQNSIELNQSFENQRQAYKLRAMEAQIEEMKRNQESTDEYLMLYILKNHPELLKRR